MPGQSKYTARSHGRGWNEVRGYLRGDLSAASVASEVLTPQSQTIAVYGLNAAGEWRYKCEATVWNYDESGDYSEGCYVRANLNDDDRFEVYWSSCDATALTVPDSPLD